VQGNLISEEKVAREACFVLHNQSSVSVTWSLGDFSGKGLLQESWNWLQGT
jgi:hypothetical protein